MTKRGKYANHKPMHPAVRAMLLRSKLVAPSLPERFRQVFDTQSMDAKQATEILTTALMEALSHSIAAAQARGELTAENLSSIAKAAGCNAAMTLMTDED